MAFYLNPPSGTLTLSSVERYVRARLNFLLKVARCHGNSVAMQDIVLDSETVTSADCLTEGSSKDCISHYVLRLACAGDKEMSSFYVRAESYFFRYRISCMTEDELVLHVVRPLQKLGELLMTEVNPLAPAMVDIAEMLGYMTYSCDIETIVHYFVEGVKNKFFVLRFEHVLKLVASRAVTVRRGKAVVPCTRLCEVLEVIFGKLLTYGMSLAKKKYAAVIEDKRFCRLFSCLRSLFYSQLSVLRGGRPSLFGVVRAEDVDALTDYYPLCMSTLHRLLKQRHRLKHADRIQYTLYLKELGMPVHEAVHFWRREYTEPAACLKYSEPAVCLRDHHDQSWGRNARRYTYNIRHLYGLEGARLNYRGHGCTALQGRSLGPLEAGGCPFSNCDSDSLQQLLTIEGIPRQHRHAIASLATEKSPQTACQMFFRQKLATALGRDMILPGEMDSRKNCDGCKSPRFSKMRGDYSYEASCQKSKGPKNTEIRQNSCCPESFQKSKVLENNQMYKQEYSYEESYQKGDSPKTPKIKCEHPSEYTYQELKRSEVTKKKLESPYKNFCHNCRNLKFGPYKNFCPNCGNLKLGSMEEECSCENYNQTSKASKVTRVQQECLVGEYCQKRKGHKAAEIVLEQECSLQDSCHKRKAFIEQGCSCDKDCEKRQNPEVTNLKQGCMEERSWHQDKRSKIEADKEWPCSRRIQGLVKTEESVTTVCTKAGASPAEMCSKFCERESFESDTNASVVLHKRNGISVKQEHLSCVGPYSDSSKESEMTVSVTSRKRKVVAESEHFCSTNITPNGGVAFSLQGSREMLCENDSRKMKCRSDPQTTCPCCGDATPRAMESITSSKICLKSETCENRHHENMCDASRELLDFRMTSSLSSSSLCCASTYKESLRCSKIYVKPGTTCSKTVGNSCCDDVAEANEGCSRCQQRTEMTLSSAPSRTTEGHTEQRMWSSSYVTKTCNLHPADQRILSSCATKSCHSPSTDQRMLSSSCVSKMCHSPENQRMLSSSCATKMCHSLADQRILSSCATKKCHSHLDEQRMLSSSCVTKRCHSPSSEQRMLSSSCATKRSHSHPADQRILSSCATKRCHSTPKEQRILSSCGTKSCHSHPEEQGTLSSSCVTKMSHSSPKEQRVLSSCVTKMCHSDPADQRLLSSCATKMCHSPVEQRMSSSCATKRCHSHPEDQRMSSLRVNKRCHSPSCTQSPPQKSPSVSNRDTKSHQVCDCVMKEKIANLNFMKPADYSSSFKKLLEGLSK